MPPTSQRRRRDPRQAPERRRPRDQKKKRTRLRLDDAGELLVEAHGAAGRRGRAVARATKKRSERAYDLMMLANFLLKRMEQRAGAGAPSPVRPKKEANALTT